MEQPYKKIIEPKRIKLDMSGMSQDLPQSLLRLSRMTDSDLKISNVGYSMSTHPENLQRRAKAGYADHPLFAFATCGWILIDIKCKYRAGI